MANTFTYVDDCTYATDPATLANVKVGDVVRVEGRFFDTPVTYTSVVRSVGFDEFGVYLGTWYVQADTYRGITEHLRWDWQASTITDKITVICAGEPTLGAYVDYFGTLASAHGRARISHECRCDTGDYSPDGHYVLHTATHTLQHVDRANFRIL